MSTDPYTKDEQVEFAKCDAQCGGKQCPSLCSLNNSIDIRTQAQNMKLPRMHLLVQAFAPFQSFTLRNPPIGPLAGTHMSPATVTSSLAQTRTVFAKLSTSSLYSIGAMESRDDVLASASNYFPTDRARCPRRIDVPFKTPQHLPEFCYTITTDLALCSRRYMVSGVLANPALRVQDVTHTLSCFSNLPLG